MGEGGKQVGRNRLSRFDVIATPERHSLSEIISGETEEESDDGSLIIIN